MRDAERLEVNYREERQTVSTRQCIASKIRSAALRDGAVAKPAIVADAAAGRTSRRVKSEFKFKLKLPKHLAQVGSCGKPHAASTDVAGGLERRMLAPLQPVKRVYQRQRTGHDDIAMRALAGDGHAVFANHAAHFAQRVGAAGNRLDRVTLQRGID